MNYLRKYTYPYLVFVNLVLRYFDAIARVIVTGDQGEHVTAWLVTVV